MYNPAKKLQDALAEKASRDVGEARATRRLTIRQRSNMDGYYEKILAGKAHFAAEIKIGDPS